MRPDQLTPVSGACLFPVSMIPGSPLACPTALWGELTRMAGLWERVLQEVSQP